ncbi:nucleoside phosphatase GDA1/CD39 [Dimargaris cristalligena]|uniref:Nucleoside phosphatase GDA1/CD39 n=1 Tax=Dimargaris cristalligena TaxID=215637 RepID=A0A4P9ZVM7_9FUNG|nr:nucleoside phosphatase GDA1/CD39 [Dimargaris cristalligena]|eukprot:RKP37655.1 nucleoside phosphatase GDA1/CD39 [Dimargaris cristalligena]
MLRSGPAPAPHHSNISNPWQGLDSIVVETDWSRHRDFTVVIDAGSSGSRVLVYSWISTDQVRQTTPDAHMLSGLPIIEKGDEEGEQWQFKEAPGISSYAAHPHRLADHIQPLLTAALRVVPSSKVAQTPIYLFATAGMRLLPPKQQGMLLDRACQYTKAHAKFYIAACSRHFQVIPGAAEGIYGWMAVNYQLNGFAKTGDRRLYDRPSEAELAQPPTASGHKHTFGFLDMGGASTQIAFEPTPAMAREHADDLTMLTLRNLDGHDVTYKVFTTTFLGFGSNQARIRHEQEMLNAWHYAGGSGATDQPPRVVTEEIHNPYPAAKSVQTITLEDPCLHPGLSLPVHPELVHDSAHRSVILKGQGSFADCARRAVNLLNKALPCPTDPCLFNGVHSPAIDFDLQQFVGISEYWYSSQDIFQLGGVWDFTTFERRASQFCSTPWDQIQREFGAKHTAERLQMQCFKAAWLATVLHDGVGLPRTTPSPTPAPPGQAEFNVTEELAHIQQEGRAHGINVPFQSVNTVNDFEVSWTLGAALIHAVSRIPARTPGWAIISFVLIMGLVGGLALLVKHISQNPYIRRRWSKKRL